MLKAIGECSHRLAVTFHHPRLPLIIRALIRVAMFREPLKDSSSN